LIFAIVANINPKTHSVIDFSELRQNAGLSVEEAAALVGYAPRTVYRWERGEAEPRKAAVEALKSVIRQKLRGPATAKAAFTFIDLFAGIGGMRMGFEAAGGRCVYTSEWDSFSQTTYRANHNCDHEIDGDITKVDAASIPEHDVLVAGFPCQPFSIAGVSKKNALGRQHGFLDETQGTLFFDVARIIAHHRPKAFLLENVKNLKSHDKGKTFEVIRRTLTEELGYNISVRIIDGKRFVPQHRERIFIVGFRDHAGFDLDALVLPAPMEGPKLASILHPEDGSEEAEAPYTEGPKAKVAAKYTLTPNLWQYLQDYAKKHQAAGNGFGFGLVGRDDVSRTLSARYYKDGSEILIRQKGKRPRRLTPRECARLMGFDHPSKPPFHIPVSDTRAYKQFGNAVIVPVVEAVARHMLPWITGEAVIQPELQWADPDLRKVA
jgi:DNA (cytosine-5)-methyltransferase 1